MRVKPAIVVIGFVLAAAGAAEAVDGGEVFTRFQCGVCHKPDQRASAVSLKEIAQTYSDKPGLLEFFRGETKPLIESEKWGLMRGRLTRIKALPDEEKDALADYILSFK